ncbi:MAG: carboxy-S-adenosyl-L-methionine synthase CmoA [Gammaproteobacteria bacterium]|nr:carboxy-S-adenosyl-L-methionine synthase CmoA [Gammaproteobacteria bacterium]NND61315.1 carboxy-S-adenosyl-L-methionine synthase CmoA [Gammaproteobacteria bacterium]
MSRDEIYKDKNGEQPFRFDASVARVFPDMLRRSIPGYAASLDVAGALAARYVQPNTNCYDLGCSLGAAALAMRQGIAVGGCRIIAIDDAPAMIERCREVVNEAGTDAHGTPIEVVQQDLRETRIENASMVTFNYTLQFVPPPDRASVIAGIHDGLRPGGVLMLSEKVCDEDPAMEELLVDLYHEHKRRNDYSALEIARKRAALENVLVPETVAAHRARLQAAGFERIAVWLRQFNFVSLIAIRND